MAACSSSSTVTDAGQGSGSGSGIQQGEPDSGEQGFPDGSVTAAYGVFADAAQFEQDADRGEPDGGPVAAYGVFVDPDAGQK